MHGLRIYRSPDDMEDLTPLSALGWATMLGAVFGFGAWVHDPKSTITTRSIIGIVLYSAGNAFVAGCCWHMYVAPGSPMGAMMAGASAGLFGFPAKNLLAFAFKKSGVVSIRFNGKKDAA